MCVLSCVQLYVAPWTAAYPFPLSTEILQARILERVAISFSRGSSRPRDQTPVSCISCSGWWLLYHCAKVGQG